MAWIPKTIDPSRPPAPLTSGRKVMADVFGEAWSHEVAFERIERGLNTHALNKFIVLYNIGRERALSVLDISPRTFDRRRSEGRLKPEEGDRFYRLVALYALAADVLGDTDAAAEWMTRPAVSLGDRTPLEYARNEAGAQRVEDVLHRIEYGVYG